jgi:predicted DNA-binding transcriptional regulator AlpA
VADLDRARFADFSGCLPETPAPSIKPGLTLAAAIEPLLTMTDLARLLVCDRRTVERLRAAGRLPRPDLHIGRLPRWRLETISAWIERGGR